VVTFGSEFDILIDRQDSLVLARIPRWLCRGILYVNLFITETLYPKLIVACVALVEHIVPSAWHAIEVAKSCLESS